MHRLTTAALTATTALLLAACGATSEPGPADAKPSATTSPEDQFLKDAKSAALKSWATQAPTDTELAAYPPQWCAKLKAGHSVANILDDQTLYPIGQDWGTAKPDAQQLVVLGVTAYCPEYREQVTTELRADGF